MADYKLQSSRFRILTSFTGTGVSQEYRLNGEKSLQIEISSANTSNVIELEGKVDSAATWNKIGYINGDKIKNFDIGKYNLLRFNVTAYSSSSNKVSLAAVSEFTEPQDPLSLYKVLNVDQASANTVYTGYYKPNGNYLVLRSIESANVTTVTFANYFNNTSRLTYSDAWTNRATLIYNSLEDLEGV